MNTRHSLNDAIVSTTLKIQEEFPELIKYMDELPEHLISSNCEKVANAALKDYLESLNELIETYSKGHQKTKKESI